MANVLRRCIFARESFLPSPLSIDHPLDTVLRTGRWNINKARREIREIERGEGTRGIYEWRSRQIIFWWEWKRGACSWCSFSFSLNVFARQINSFNFQKGDGFPHNFIVISFIVAIRTSHSDSSLCNVAFLSKISRFLPIFSPFLAFFPSLSVTEIPSYTSFSSDTMLTLRETMSHREWERFVDEVPLGSHYVHFPFFPRIHHKCGVNAGLRRSSTYSSKRANGLEWRWIASKRSFDSQYVIAECFTIGNSCLRYPVAKSAFSRNTSNLDESLAFQNWGDNGAVDAGQSLYHWTSVTIYWCTSAHYTRSTWSGIHYSSAGRVMLNRVDIVRGQQFFYNPF